MAIVYASPEYVSTLATSTPASAHVAVDFELQGCPPDKRQLLEVISAFLHERRPAISDHSVCVECKRAGNVCVMVAHGTPCLGPGHARGLRRAVPELPPRLLRLLRADGGAEPGRARRPPRAGGGRRRAAVPHLLRGRAGVRRVAWLSASSRSGPLARVEGEGSLHVRLRDGRVEEVRLEIFEPPRFFEAFLRGRAFTEVPDITARICGICPVAYQMSSIAAMEDVCGVEVPEPVRALRRLLYCGEWIESHALHVFFLHGPDYLGYDSAFAMARDHRGIVERALQLKKAGNALMRVVGGREIHPVNVRLGGFYRAPTRAELAPVVEELEVAREFAREAVAWTAGLPCPDLEEDFEFVALRAPDTYAIESGRLASSSGLDLAPGGVRGALRRAPGAALDGAALAVARRRPGVPHRAARPLRAQRRPPLPRRPRGGGRGRARVRRAATRSRASSCARSRSSTPSTRRCGCSTPTSLPTRRPSRSSPRAGTGYGWSEAPRGMLWHRYAIDEQGTILDARIVPPTSQNQARIEQSLATVVAAHAALPDDELQHRCEQAVRSFDPCISCATHFLRLEVERC